MTALPPPRPALRRSGDGVVRAVPVPRSALTVDPAAVDRAASRKPKKKETAEVELTVVVPRRVRKKLRRKADRYGWSAEQAAAHVLRAWADG